MTLANVAVLKIIYVHLRQKESTGCKIFFLPSNCNMVVCRKCNRQNQNPKLHRIVYRSYQHKLCWWALSSGQFSLAPSIIPPDRTTINSDRKASRGPVVAHVTILYVLV